VIRVADLQTDIIGGDPVTASRVVVYPINVSLRPWSLLIVFRAVNTADSPCASDKAIFIETVVIDLLYSNTQDLDVLVDGHGLTWYGGMVLL
jgi:hypothetical protein